MGTDKTYVNKIFKEIANNYATIMNQNDFIDQTVFSARFEKQNEDGQMLIEIEIYIKLKNNQN